MSLFAKVLALIVLAGAVLGLIGAVTSAVRLAASSASEGLIEAAGAAYLVQVGLSFFFLLATITLAILVLIAPNRSQ